MTLIVGLSFNVAPEATWQFSNRYMAKQKPSSDAINDILSTSDSVVSDGGNSSDEFSENQELDCEIVECNETNNDDDLPSQPSTSAVSLLSVLKAPRLSDLARK